jgi:hypothetical protein
MTRQGKTDKRDRKTGQDKTRQDKKRKDKPKPKQDKRQKTDNTTQHNKRQHTTRGKTDRQNDRQTDLFSILLYLFHEGLPNIFKKVLGQGKAVRQDKRKTR